MQTEITSMFGIRYPVICGGMMWICKPGLCAAISNAGGMGNLTASNYNTEDEFRNAIRETRRMTNMPFMVNVTALPSIRITADHHKMYLHVCAEEKVAGIEVSGMPLDQAAGMDYIEMLKKAGVKLFHKVGAVRHAVHAEAVGYDGVYAAGIEEGGHPLDDDVTTMILATRIAEAVSIPVVAAGGISNGRTMAAAMMLGAQGVMMATRFVATRECEIHKDIKKELVNRQEYETTLICKTLGLQARALRNKNVAQILELEKKGSTLKEILPLIMGSRIVEAWESGDVDHAPMMVGQSVGLIHDIPTCSVLLESMVSEMRERMEEVQKSLSHN